MSAISEQLRMTCDWCPTRCNECREIELQAAAELDRLQAIVNRMPKTADGVPIMPDSIVWLDRQRYVVLAVGQHDCWIALSYNRERRQWVSADRLYSSSDAEEKGRL